MDARFIGRQDFQNRMECLSPSCSFFTPILPALKLIPWILCARFDYLEEKNPAAPCHGWSLSLPGRKFWNFILLATIISAE
jgi:hypothetical protein